jgi:NADH dehydrogenase (ubiquinone) 1 beta subcomplex subunit 9
MAHKPVFKMEAALTHTQRVLRLYRHALQHSRSWEVNRKLWRQEALTIRGRFEQHRNETNRIAAQQLLEAGEVRILFFSFPAFLIWCP